MDVIPFLIALALSGLVVGALGRLALPGKDPMSVWQTILVGLAGSFLAGMIGALLFGRGVASIALSVLCATGIVYLIRRRRGGTFTRPPPTGA
jgi:uncharacterized membrane protein YeaQ/YmgE (transglycosylase-associated protein family)